MQNTPRSHDVIWSLFLTVQAVDIPRYVFALEVLPATVAWQNLHELPGDVAITVPETTQLEILLAPESPCQHNDIVALLETCLAPFDLKPHIDSIKKLPHKNWLEENQKQFPPLTCGPFFIYSSYYKDSLPTDKIPLHLNAALAFGSGEHETTRGCLLALDRLKQQQNFLPRSILDLGCGSGILAIAAAKLWPHSSVLASDFDHFAVKTTQTNAQTNQTPQVVAQFSDGFDALPHRYFDLILANILAGPLIEFAADIYAHLAPKGHLVLSGLLERQAPAVQTAYEQQGLILKESFCINSWSTLFFEKNPDAPLSL